MSTRIRSRRIFPFDVDDTLVIWDAPAEERTLVVKCPYSDNSFFYLKPNFPMVELLKTKSARGHHIIVWSQSGEEWADAVIKALGIENYVHQTSDKFNEYADDLPVQAWAETRVLLKPDSKWRNND